VGFAGLVLRLLRSNPTVQVAPRRTMAGTLVLVCSGLAWQLTIATAQALQIHPSNLSLVDGLSAQGLQVFTPARYARELLGKHYIWMDDAATPPLGWWPLKDTWAEPNDIIRQYANPQDPWSNADALTDERKENERISKKQGFGLGLASQAIEPQPGAALGATGKPPSAAQTARRVTDVKVGSPAALAGVQRGDTLVEMDGQPVTEWLAGNAKRAATLGIRTRSGAVITLTQRGTFPDTGVQQVSWLDDHHLYLRLDHFGPDTALYLAKALRELDVSRVTSSSSSSSSSTSLPIRLVDLHALIIDLRDNPGGNVRSAEETGRLLFGRNLAKQRVERNTRWPNPSQDGAYPANSAMNPAGRNEPLIYTRDVSLISSGMLRVQNWSNDISGDTCSSSEYLIHGLRTLTDIDVVTIGDTTCGKPYGFQLRDYAGYRFSVVDQATQSPSGQRVYPNGMAPTCKVIDPIAVPFTQPGDAVLEAARFYAQHQRCPA
jgi:hypothetical protein